MCVLQLTSVGIIVKQDVALSLLTKMLQDVIQADEVIKWGRRVFFLSLALFYYTILFVRSSTSVLVW